VSLISGASVQVVLWVGFFSSPPCDGSPAVSPVVNPPGPRLERSPRAGPGSSAAALGGEGRSCRSSSRGARRAKVLGSPMANHRMVGVGRDLYGSPSPTPCRSRVTYSRLHRTLSRRAKPRRKTGARESPSARAMLDAGFSAALPGASSEEGDLPGREAPASACCWRCGRVAAAIRAVV